MHIEVVKRWLEAKRVKKELDKALKGVNEELENLEISILDQLASDGVTGVKVDGATVYISEMTKADVDYKLGESTDEGYDRTCDALIENGLGHLVKRRFFHQSVSAWLASAEGDPDLLKPFMRITKVRKLGVRNLKGEE
jgi:hypothetical protein